MEMKNVVIVQVTSGKNESVDTSRIELFTNSQDAQRYCDDINRKIDTNSKYWTYAETVQVSDLVELLAPYDF